MGNLGMIILILFSAHLHTPGMGLLSASGNSFLLPRLLFCKSNMINHYFCNLLLLLELSCSNTFISEVLALFLCVFTIVLPVMTILSSYIFIIVTFLQINEMRADPRPAVHAAPTSTPLDTFTFSQFPGTNTSSSVFYIIVVLLLNLMTHSLRNKVVKVALKMLIQKIKTPEIQMPLFFLFIGIYVVTVAGNLGMITLIVFSPNLHNPMYYFLSSLSFIDFCQSTVVTPKMLVNFVREKNHISYPGCMTQLYFFIIFGAAECHTLGVMAYDRFVAICNPLLYSVTMSYQISSALITGVYIFGMFNASVIIGFMVRIQFCKLDEINHYFCDLLPLLELACSNTYITELLILGFGTFNICVPILTIITSYISIIANILRMKSIVGRSKAFSTCSSHISAVAVYFGSAAFMYLYPSPVNSMNKGKVPSVFYTTVVPMLNPLIYSLRNKDVSVALKKILQRKKFMFE
ncbi:hypothetical protein U0070_002229, partial [Myodes glareolus]